MRPTALGARARALRGAAAVLAGGWCALAVYFVTPWSAAGAALGALVLLGSVTLSQRPRGLAIAAGGWALGLSGFALGVAPRNDRDWIPEQAVLAGVRWSRDVNHVTVAGVRSFRYRSTTDFDERWETRSFDLDTLVGIDVLVSDWGSADIAHTMLSWVFSRDEPLVVSIEARREHGESYHPLPGLFRRFELYYAVADERDVVEVRTDHRHERVRLYRLSTPPALARELLLEYLAAIERLAHEPAFYDSILRNCTTTTARHAASIGVRSGWDWRLFANGHLDELLYERGVLDTTTSLAELRARSDVTEVARTTPADAPDYSERIRAGLPPRPAL